MYTLMSGHTHIKNSMGRASLPFWHYLEVVYVTIGNLAFCFLCLFGVHFRGELQHVGDVSEQKIKCWPIRTWEIRGAKLQDGLYARADFRSIKMKCMEHAEKGNATNRKQMMSLKVKDISLSFMVNFTSAYEIIFFK